MSGCGCRVEFVNARTFTMAELCALAPAGELLRAIDIPGTEPRIVYCPLHSAAERLAAALRAMIAECEAVADAHRGAAVVFTPATVEAQRLLWEIGR